LRSDVGHTQDDALSCAALRRTPFGGRATAATSAGARSTLVLGQQGVAGFGGVAIAAIVRHTCHNKGERDRGLEECRGGSGNERNSLASLALDSY